MSDTGLVEHSQKEMSFKEKLKNWIGHEEFSEANIWKALLAEFLGTGLLVLVGCGSCTPWVPKKEPGEGSWEQQAIEPTVVQIGLSFGLIVATIVKGLGHVSGGHINPAVTLGCVINGRCSILRGVLYLIVQLIGAVVGAVILKQVTPSKLESQLGVTALGANMNGFMGLLVEYFITFVLVLTVLAVIDPNSKDKHGSAPLAIGLSIAACHMFAVKFTGSSMNTARSFGPAIINNSWANHWVYWVGPLLGGATAGVLYKFLFENPPEGEEPPTPRGKEGKEDEGKQGEDEEGEGKGEEGENETNEGTDQAQDQAQDQAEGEAQQGNEQAENNSKAGGSMV